jgi:hypothetical protein
MSAVACLVVPYYSAFSKKGMIFGKIFIEYKTRVLILSTTFV